MIVWMFNHYAITPQFPGGTRHFELGRNLAAQGHQVVLFASGFIHMNFSTVPVDRKTGYKIENHGGLEFVWVKGMAYRRNDWKRFANMLNYCRNARKTAKRLLKENKIEKPDVIIGSTVHPFTPLMAARLARKFNVPFIFEIRDLWPETFIDMGVWKRTSIQARVFKAIEKRTVEKARKIIALSPKTQKYLEQQYNYSPEDIQYIPNGVYIGSEEDVTMVERVTLKRSEVSEESDVNEESEKENRTLQALRKLKEDGSFVVLFSGSLITTNRLETIIDAAELLKEDKKIKIIMIGKGQEEERYRSLIAEKKLENIVIHPPVRKDQVPVLLKRADVLILNQGNVQWGSSNKLYDYMASQRPIISSVHAKHNDIIGRINGGISISPQDPLALKEAILKLHKIPGDEKKAMGSRNLGFVSANHDWKLLALRLSRMIETFFDPGKDGTAESAESAGVSRTAI